MTNCAEGFIPSKAAMTLFFNCATLEAEPADGGLDIMSGTPIISIERRGWYHAHKARIHTNHSHTIEGEVDCRVAIQTRGNCWPVLSSAATSCSLPETSRSRHNHSNFIKRSLLYFA
jgi:hypothetical protein